MTQEDPKFIPLEEFYSEHVMNRMLDEPNFNDLVFENEFREEVK